MAKFSLAAAALCLAALPLAADAAASKLEVVAPATARTNEAVDVTVRALSSDGTAARDYAGTVFFIVEGDAGAIVPYSQDGYSFIDKDQGVKLFSKGVTFRKAGKMKLRVEDLDDANLSAEAEVTVSADAAVVAGNEPVAVVSPEANVSVSETKIPVVGKTKASSTVTVSLNGAKVADSQTDANGNFKFDVPGLKEGANEIKVDVLDGSDQVIGTSGPIAVKYVSGGAALKGLSVKETQPVLAGSTVTFVAASDARLPEVLLSVDGKTYPMTEDAAAPGAYSAKVLVASAGAFPADVTLKNALGVVSKVSAAATLQAIQPVLSATGAAVSSGTLSIGFSLVPDLSSAASFSLSYSTGSATGAVAVLPRSAVATASGLAWSAPAPAAAGSYQFRLAALTASGTEIPGLSATGSFEVAAPAPAATATGELAAAPAECSVGSIEDIRVSTDGKTKSTLSWDAVPGAASYDVYKKDADGQPALVENVKGTSYVVHIRGREIAFGEFSVKAVCLNPDGKKNESPEFKQMVKVQTGPEVFLAILALAAGAGFLATRFATVRK